MRTTLRYFRSALAVTVAGLVAAFWLGWAESGDLGDALNYLLIGAALAALEISLSFDNAIVNAATLNTMTPVWRHRFLTWGMLIAVFGMRLVFPLAIVAVAAHLGPLDALRLALFQPAAYAHILDQAHLAIAAFGGTFLMMVALHYFIDERKEVDWIIRLECRMRACASLEGLETAFVLIVILGFALMLPETDLPNTMIVAEKLRARLAAARFEAAGTVIGLTVSIGVTVLLPGDHSLFDAIKRADDALYRAKREGRNRVVPITAPLSTAISA